MANFNITIDAEPNIPYVPTYNKIRQGDCLTGVTGVPLGIVNDTNTPGINFLLSEYTGGLGWKTLNISNITYSQPTWFDLEYNSVTLTPNVDPNVVVQAIPVTGLATNAAIPLFFANYDNDLATGNASLQFDLEIIDTGDTSLGKIRAGIIFLYVECIPPVTKAPIVQDSYTDTSCLTSMQVTVKVPAEGSRYVSGINSDPTYGSFSPALTTETITADKTYTMTIDANNAGSTNGEYTVMQILVKEAATSPLFLGGKTISRNHSVNIC